MNNQCVNDSMHRRRISGDPRPCPHLAGPCRGVGRCRQRNMTWKLPFTAILDQVVTGPSSSYPSPSVCHGVVPCHSGLETFSLFFGVKPPFM